MSHQNQNLNDPLSVEELIYLDHMLTSQCELSIFQVHGLLSATISGPRVLPTQTWLSAILGENPIWNSMDEVKKVMNLIMRLNNQIASALMEEALFFPLVDYVPVDSFRADDLTDEQKLHLRLWCQGYVQGVALDGEMWIQEGEEPLGKFLLAFYTLRKENPTPEDIRLQIKKKPSQKEWEAHLKQTINLLPKLIPIIYDFWRDNDRMRSVNAIKPTDSAICPCDSGKLFEACCQFTGALH